MSHVTNNPRKNPCIRDKQYHWLISMTLSHMWWNESCHTYEWVVNESCRTCGWVMSQYHWLISMTLSHMWWAWDVCDTTHPHVWHNPSTCTAWLIYDSFIRVTWLILCVARLIHMCDMTHTFCVECYVHMHFWPIHVCDSTQSNVGHLSFTLCGGYN